MKPKVTIGLCVRNCEEYVKEAIDSLARQNFPHKLMELIFVDDGSVDNTLSIIQECVSRVDIPIKVFHTPWKGLGHARNMVIASAEGEYITWVDGDMILSTDYVKKQFEFMEQHPKVGIAKGKQALELRSNLLATLESCSRAAGRMVDYNSKRARSKALGTGGSIYRFDALAEVGEFDENLRNYGEDWDIETRFRAAGWSLQTMDVEFSDYERHGLTWKTLWKRYWLRGYHNWRFLRKNKGFITHSKMIPPVAFVTGLFHSHRLFGLTNRRSVFLLPFQYSFKMTAWYTGFLTSELDSHKSVQR